MRGIAVVLVVVLLGCSSEPAEPSLPDACYGTWELTGSSGGMDGMGTTVPKGNLLVLEPGNVAERRSPGQPPTRAKFTVRQDKTIYSSEPGWFIESGSLGLNGVVFVSEDGKSLTISDNHYDGFSSHYRRVEARK